MTTRIQFSVHSEMTVAFVDLFQLQSKDNYRLSKYS